jgi:hypothetical protein
MGGWEEVRTDIRSNKIKLRTAGRS